MVLKIKYTETLINVLKFSYNTNWEFLLLYKPVSINIDMRLQDNV